METVKQFKMRSRNEIQDLKAMFGLRNREIAEASGITEVTVGKIINRCHVVSAETVEKTLLATREICRYRMKEAMSNVMQEATHA
mgnify:CR=1 FL=1|tara:strand:- start:389 stop:643 length:255 start_codon:yes stop_codon:yes gene_type:complete